MIKDYIIEHYEILLKVWRFLLLFFAFIYCLLVFGIFFITDNYMLDNNNASIYFNLFLFFLVIVFIIIVQFTQYVANNTGRNGHIWAWVAFFLPFIIPVVLSFLPVNAQSKCKLGVHSWNGCKCTICSALKDKDHSWDGCMCKICGKTRDQEHLWDGCICKICGKTRDQDHSWNDSMCECKRCGSTRDLFQAIDKIRDESVLINIAKTEHDRWLRKKAVKYIENESALISIFKTDSNIDVCAAAMERIKNQSFLTEIAKNDNRISLRIAAAEKLQNESIKNEILIEIAKNDYDPINRKTLNPLIRIKAAKQLYDESIKTEILINISKKYIEIFKKNDNLNMRIKAVRYIEAAAENLHDESIKSEFLNKTSKMHKLIENQKNIEKKYDDTYRFSSFDRDEDQGRGIRSLIGI